MKYLAVVILSLSLFAACSGPDTDKKITDLTLLVLKHQDNINEINAKMLEMENSVAIIKLDMEQSAAREDRLIRDAENISMKAIKIIAKSEEREALLDRLLEQKAETKISAASAITVEKTAAAQKYVYVSGPVLNMRKDATQYSGLVHALSKGDKLEVTGEKNNGSSVWYKVNFGKYSGYVSSNLVSENAAAKERYAVVTASRLNVREKETPNSGIVTKLSSGTKVKIVNDDGVWWLIESGTRRGYVNNRYLKTVN